MTERDPWLLAAQRLDAWRIIPRLILLFYFVFFGKAWYFIVNWFVSYDWSDLPADQIVGATAVVAVAGFPAIILGILTKVLFQLIEMYCKKPGYGTRLSVHEPPPDLGEEQ